jgi:hypothetical protein
LISTRIIKDAIDVVGEPLVDIINESLETGVMPDLWKISTIVPIAKVNGSIQCEDFRPIIMLPTMEKIMEKVVKVQLMEY